jgi:hypothetical protein
LRARALAGDPAGWQCGLGVLQHRGVVAWLRAWGGIPAAAQAPAREPAAALPSCGVADRLVDALAAMALAVVRAGR